MGSARESLRKLFTRGGHGEGLARQLAGQSFRQMADRGLLDQIGQFLFSADLPVTAHNLLIAHAAFSGQDQHLARAIDARRARGDAITQDWLDASTAAIDPATGLDRMIRELESSIAGLTRSTSTARANAADCNAALEREVTRAAQIDPATSLAAIVSLARAMLERNRVLEADMRAREAEAHDLRERLARAQHDANLDHLTGLPNRRAFEVVLEEQVHLARSGIEVMSVAFCDIDHFKHVNDRHGHETGDRVLREIAATLARLTNDRCHVARHGGEEFVMLFRGLDKHAAGAKLDGVRDTLSQRRFVNRKSDEPIGQITFSAGVADVFAYPSPREALRAADQALYAAKQHGRNTVVIAP